MAVRKAAPKGKRYMLAEDMRHRIALGRTAVEKPKRTFKAIADEWLENRIIPIRAASYVDTIRKRMNKHVIPAIGDKTVNDITPQEVLSLSQT